MIQNLHNWLQSIEKLLFFLLILFLPTQLGKHFWPDWSYIFSLRIDYLSPTIYLWDILCLLLVVIFLFRKPKVNKLAVGCLLIFLLSQLISLIDAVNIGAGLVRVEQYLLVGLFGVYIASKRFMDIKSGLYWGLVIGMLLESLLVIIQVVGSSSVGLWILGERDFSIATNSIAKFDWYGQVFLRGYGTFPHPNVMGAFLLISLIIIQWLGVIKSKTLKLLLFGLGSTGMFLSFSRAIILGLGVFLTIKYKHKIKLLLLVLVIVSPFLYVRFGSAFNFDVLSIYRRGDLALIALVGFFNNFVDGVGVNNFINYLSDSELVSGPNRFLQPVHNIFLLQLVEGGLIGSIGFLSLIGIAIQKSWKQSGSLKLLWLIIFILGLFDHYFLTIQQGYRLLFLVWGLSMLEYQGGDNKKSY